MNLTGIFKRDRSLKSAFATLEADMDDVLQTELLGDAVEIGADERDPVTALLEIGDVPSISPEHAEPGLTAYTQERLSALSNVEMMYQEASEDLKALGQAFSHINAVHHLTREFLATTQSTIHRMNDLEQSNARFQSENNKLRRQAELVKRLKAQHETLMEGTRRREAKAQQELDKFRQLLAEARLETIDARTAMATMETERGDLMNALTTRTADAERLGRENEVLRERYVNQTADLDQVGKRAGDIQRRLDEVTALHHSDANHLAEARSRIAVAEGELMRMQKQNDKLQFDLGEAASSISSLERQIDEMTASRAAESQLLANENEALRAKIAVLSNAQSEAVAEVSALKHRIKDAETDARIADIRMQQMKQEMGAEPAEAAANDGELAALRAEIEELNATVKRLAVYERFYRSVKTRKCEKAREQAAAIETRANGDDAEDAEALPAPAEADAAAESKAYAL